MSAGSPRELSGYTFIFIFMKRILLVLSFLLPLSALAQTQKASLTCVGDEFGEMHLGVGVEGVARVECPAFVHEHVAHAVAGGEINEVLIGVEVDA